MHCTCESWIWCIAINAYQVQWLSGTIMIRSHIHRRGSSCGVRTLTRPSQLSTAVQSGGVGSGHIPSERFITLIAIIIISFLIQWEGVVVAYLPFQNHLHCHYSYIQNRVQKQFWIFSNFFWLSWALLSSAEPVETFKSSRCGTNTAIFFSFCSAIA